MRTRRPWGSYKVINEGEGFKVKVIEVKPGKRISLQSHDKRSEHWVVVEGEATVTIDDQSYVRGANESIYVPKKTKHRLENKLETLLRIVEVQCGPYTGEDDIERYEDDYNRE